MSYRSQHHRSRLAARFALLAMLLLVTGPLIGQLRAAGHTGHTGHTGHISHVGHTGHISHAGHTGHNSHAGHGDTQPQAAFGWHAQCGYCSLFQQVPVLMAMLPYVAPVASPAITAPVVATRRAHGGAAVFPQALTRAPPVLTR
ncbi:DUF2946 domain-containing protein [Bisbaumannia pacifica]|uniref:DUF2946 domain-containing protein n=1 Tax=Bisbaumannia pacifica TaxID=77098 RepID=A0ABD4KXP1_9GAMM|nr:DUF2946 domain-containing protein [Halomonas pacifica]MBH8579210.1 DUF2946 domain-containing protein [Halomonas pacifica]